jgi:hypothetical protein
VLMEKQCQKASIYSNTRKSPNETCDQFTRELHRSPNAFEARPMPPRPDAPPLARTPELRSRLRCNLMQAVENLCSWYGLNFSRIKTCDAPCNLCVPSCFRARLRIGFHADKKPVGESHALVGRQDQGILREGIECRRHALRYDRKREVSTPHGFGSPFSNANSDNFTVLHATARSPARPAAIRAMAICLIQRRSTRPEAHLAAITTAGDGWSHEKPDVGAIACLDVLCLR